MKNRGKGIFQRTLGVTKKMTCFYISPEIMIFQLTQSSVQFRPDGPHCEDGIHCVALDRRQQLPTFECMLYYRGLNPCPNLSGK